MSIASNPNSRTGHRLSIVVTATIAVLVIAACAADETDDRTAVDAPDPNHSHEHDRTASDVALPDVTLADSDVTVVVANSPGTLVTAASQRLMTALVDPGGVGYLGSAQDPVEVVVRPIDAPGAAGDDQRLAARWLSAHDAGIGLYLSEPVFDAAGIWEVRIESHGHDIGGTLVDVVVDPTMPLVGAAAPTSDSPTSDGLHDLTVISTDPDPNPSFYELSIEDAVTGGTPSLIVFATPAFCRTALCGPTMKLIKEAVADRQSDLDVVHVEPYDLDEARAGNLMPVPAMVEWKLPSEPWVFVVDGSGRITAAFEGIFGGDELTAALDDAQGRGR